MMKLTPMQDPNSLFDEQIRESLIKINPTHLPAHWNAFSTLLDQALPSEEMPETQGLDQEFDSALAQKLNHLPQSAPAQIDWSAFAVRLQEEMPVPEPSEEDMELKGVREKLNRIQPVYQKENWQRLETEMLRRNSLLFLMQRYHVLKVAAVFLVGATMLNLWITQPWEVRPGVNLVAIPVVQPPTSSSISSINSNPVFESTNTPTTRPEEIAKSKNAANTSPSIVDEALSLQKTNIPESGSPVLGALPVFNQNMASASPLFESVSGADLTTATYTIEDEQSAPLLASVEAKNVFISPPIHKIRLQELPPNTNLTNLATRKLKGRTDQLWRLGISASPNLDYVVSPSVMNTKGVKGRDVYAGGFTFGLQAERFLGNGWSIEMGLAYDNKNYRTPIRNNIGNDNQGYYSLDFKSVVFRMARLPLHVRKYLSSGRRFRLYAQAGANANLVLQSSFNKKFKSLGKVAPIDNTGMEIVDSADDVPVIFTDGILAEGELNQNLYLSLDIAAGCEYMITPNFHLFSEPQYQHSVRLTQITPTKDRFNTVSLNIGMRHKL